MSSIYRKMTKEQAYRSKDSEKTCPSATLSNTNPTWPALGYHPDFYGERIKKPELK
jgi:hypothetical protein